MRILRIGMLNLNSLRGAHAIDFTVPPLVDYPLYAIVGPTGAGKTTILDAVTLALYGHTERNRRVTDRKSATATVMTYGTAKCHAEVEYETATGRYRNVWRRHRAHKKVVNDLVASQVEISKYNTQTGEFDILATKKREVSQLTEEIVGLDYDRFVRSVMLTQGDFDRFLKSDSGEKAAILEQITGTEVYRDLSVAAFRRHRLARETYDRAAETIAHGLPLETDSRRALEKQLEEGLAASERVSTELALLTTQLASYASADKLTAELAAASAEHRRLTEAWEALADERQRLHHSDELEPLREALVSQSRLTSELQTLASQRTAVESTVNATTEMLRVATERVAKVKEELMRFREQEPAREERLCRAELIEQAITGLQRDAQQTDDRLSRHLRSRQQLSAEVTRTNQEISRLHEQLAGYHPEEIERESQRLEAEISHLEQKASTLTAGIAYRQLEARSQEKQVEMNEVRQQYTVITLRKEATKQRVDTAEQHMELQLAKRQNAELRASLKEHRARLKDGEACPLCGSVHHPLTSTEVPSESEVEQLSGVIHQAQIELTEAENEDLAADKQVRDLERRLDAAAASQTELTLQLAAYDRPPGEELEALLPQQVATEEQLAQLRDTLTKLRTIRPRLPELRGKEVSLAQARNSLAVLDQEIAELKQSLSDNGVQLTRQRATLRELNGTDSVTQCRRKYADHASQLQQQVDRLGQQAQRAATEATAATTQWQLLTSQHERTSVELRKLDQQLREALVPHACTIEQAWQRLLTTEAAAALRRQLQTIEQKRAKSTALVERIVREVELARRQLQGLAERTTLQTTHARLETEVTQANRRVGALQQQLHEDDARREKTAALQQELLRLEKDRDRWGRMNELIGSADGKKFRSFAQGITLQHLVDIGNRHLKTINPRYRMAYAPPEPGDKETLELEIIDTYMNDNRRGMTTLSGGESFLVSLALALGLSDLASGKQLIQSLFIDEGFGTLDGKTLDQAMSTLEQLQAQGKTIGIISHVQQLRERINCQIQLEPVGDGFSRIELTS